MHLWTYNDLKNVKASSNPLMFCEGGCHIKLDYDETIDKAIKTFTWSFGYIGLNEASYLMTSKEIHEDNTFATKVLKHLEKRIEESKNKYDLLFALYGTPAESLSFKFRDLDFQKYGNIKKVTDKSYYMNSFHVNVNAHINPIEKHNAEKPMFDISTGGRIQYVEFPNTKNKKAIKQVVAHAMELGFYEGINLELDSCDDCYESGEFKDQVCPNCGSTNITEVCRVCGYAGYKKLNGDTRFNNAKYDETEDRVDHVNLNAIIKENYMIKDFDINNGDGIRVTFWVYGCPFKCDGCHNKEMWTKKSQKHITDEDINLILNLLEKDISKDFSILGGEPLVNYNIEDVTKVCRAIKSKYPNKNIWLWTGFKFEQVKHLDIMKYIDVLINGQFIKKLHREDLNFRGSSNQRIIKVQESLKKGKIILSELNN